ncbi:hypothetical protein HBN50_00285 [Halobacteriovorax sp. GB3]|uniref:hypothetical protein n=1 Tax=Halobacteriovorax sp. GB3 TaxID=2719615 RepID=UPI0023622958|nr:hypothetical protein [Halobacteriovorax sp. GB3]MDD0851504.1 hypothetical protein [Halobacteriovorax sp. GB3]
MKNLFFTLLLVFFSSCSTKREYNFDWESLAWINGHHYFEGKEAQLKNVENKREVASSQDFPNCEDQTEQEREELDRIISKTSGVVVDANDYKSSIEGFQDFLSDSGVSKKFSAREMVKPFSSSAAKSCGLETLLPNRCRWKSAAAQALVAMKLREVINDDRPNGKKGIFLRNWWRPNCYNKAVSGASTSDHRNARGFDLDFKSVEDRMKAQKYLCEMYKEMSPLSLQVGIGCQTIHLGIGSPKRLPNYPADGSRFWKYGSLNRCDQKRIEGDDCWRFSGEEKKLFIHTNKSSTGVL